MESTDEQLLDFVRERGVVRARDLVPAGFPRQRLRQLTDAGQLERVARGLYSLPDSELAEHRTVAEVAVRVPHGVIALLSALQLHDLTDQMPHRVWVAIGPKDRAPKTELPIRIVRFSGPALAEAVQERTIHRVSVRVTSPEKTVADCFKYRNKIGLDVAIHALRRCLQSRQCQRTELLRCAAIDRVANVIRPYLESVA